MTRKKIHEAFCVDTMELQAAETWPKHQHNYFQIMYMESGQGTHQINDVILPYRPMSIFLISPGDTHSIEAKTDTLYNSFKFTELLFVNVSQLPDRKYWLQQIEHILHHPNIMPSDCIEHEEDRKRLWRIHNFIMEEYKGKSEFHWSIITNGLTTTLSIIARNILKKYSASNVSPASLSFKKSDLILSYIRQNVYEQELIKIEQLAAHFNMSETSISTLFKKETGESIRQYIINYKLMLAKYRLTHTICSIQEIAYELGFSDESHLTKSFKGKFELSPKQYRIEHRPSL